MSDYDHQYKNKTYPFGPYLYHGSVDPSFVQDLLREGEKTTGTITHPDGTVSEQDIGTGLAGQMRKGAERQFNPDQQRWFKRSLNDVFNLYTQQRMAAHNQVRVPDYIIENVWINYQVANEFQPDHVHAGDFSWVIFLQIPDGLEQERQEHKKKGAPPGSIVFNYGEGVNTNQIPWATTYYDFVPAVGDMFVFPAQLRHYVPPFTCSGTRISVSGNGTYQKPDEQLWHMGEKRYKI